MITIFSATNPPNSERPNFSKKYVDLFTAKGANVKLLELEKIPHDWFFSEMYSSNTEAKSIAAIQEEYIFPAEKLFFTEILP